MLRKTQLVWKVNSVILVILVSVLGVLSYVTNVVYEGDALRTAREISRVNSRTILESIRELMMRRDTASMEDLFGRLLLPAQRRQPTDEPDATRDTGAEDSW